MAFPPGLLPCSLPSFGLTLRALYLTYIVAPRAEHSTQGHATEEQDNPLPSLTSDAVLGAVVRVFCTRQVERMCHLQ